MSAPTLAARYRAACAALGLPVWRPGMQTSSKFSRVVAVDASTGDPACAEAGATEDDCASVWMPSRVVEPDFNDPATLGCLLAAAREAWRDPELCTYAEKHWWGTNGVSGWEPSYGPPDREPILTERTEGAAIVAVLESAVANLDRLRLYVEQRGGR